MGQRILPAYGLKIIFVNSGSLREIFKSLGLAFSELSIQPRL
ncbi:hypothetical protein [Deinococcus alpinitundrae]|nr:hypothetical protein [Deinococcus alpinitundrae]